MKIATNAGELAAALSLAELALDVRIVIAILGGVHIAGRRGRRRASYRQRPGSRHCRDGNGGRRGAGRNHRARIGAGRAGQGFC